MKTTHYKKYVGQFVKRFYTPFKKQNIFEIKAHRINEGIDEYLYDDGVDRFWADCEDSCIITNETPILEVDWVANVNHKDYKGFNPFTKQTKE